MAGVVGQGRKFAVDDALDAATLLFWEHGYEGASLKMLTETMGINPPSLYKAFGSKEDLFFSCIDYYNDSYGSFLAEAFARATSASELVRLILHGAADHYARPDFPGGCLTISAAVTVTPDNRHVAERLSALRMTNVNKIADAYARDMSNGRLVSDMAPEVLATFVGATIQGMSQQARDGSDAVRLHEIADLALVALPAEA